METSETINELAAALAKAQGAFTAAERSGKNTHLKNTYATLADVLDACRAPLAENGLSYVQVPIQAEVGWVHVETRLLHTSGQWITSVFGVPVTGQNNAHGIMGALTYARRGGLSALLGIAVDADDDGNAATGTGEGKPQGQTRTGQTRTAPPKPEPPTAPKNGNGQAKAPEGESPASPVMLNKIRTDFAGLFDVEKTAQDWYGRDFAALTAQQGAEMLRKLTAARRDAEQEAAQRDLATTPGN